MAIECRRCLLTDEVPDVTIAEDGECSACKAHDAAWRSWPEVRARRTAELERLLAAARRANRPYDVLVPLSGGKDSTYVLYLARRRFGLRCLAATFDNGFLSEHARANIGRAVEALQVDHVFFRPDVQALRALYRTFFLKTGFFCPACMLAIDRAMIRTAAADRIPLILKGTSSRTEEYVSPRFFLPGGPRFHEAVVDGEPVAARSSLTDPRGLTRRLLLHLAGAEAVVKYSYGAVVDVPDYLDWDYDEIFATIAREVGWRADRPDAEHSDCRVDPAVDYIRERKYPALVPELTRYSKLVTLGVLSKEQARAKLHLPPPGAPPPEPAALGVLLDALGLTRDEFEAVIADHDRHLPYLEKARSSARATALRLAHRLLGRGRARA